MKESARKTFYRAKGNLLRLLGRKPKNEYFIAETDEGDLYHLMFSKGCPDCGNPPQWMSGPSGGMSTNVFCAHCGQGFNVTPVIGTAQRIHKNPRYILSKEERAWPK